MHSRSLTPAYGVLQGSLFTATLAAFAVAQPLYDLISQNPAFLTAHHATPSDTLLVMIGLSVAIPIALATLQAIARVAGRTFWWLIHSTTVISLTALLAIPVLNRWTELPDIAALGLALILGTGFYVGLLRYRSLQTLLAVTSAGILLFPLLFALNPRIQAFLFPPDTTLELPPVSARNPVILLVLDELPLTSLLDENRQIDRHRYPNFARLADVSTWFRNATTVSDDTVSGAVPAILTGQYPDSNVRYRESATSLFTLLGGTYDLRVTETYTRVCPAELCPTATLTGERRMQLLKDLSIVLGHIVLPTGMRSGLPDISQGWKNFQSKPLSKSQQRSNRLDQLWDSRAAWLNQLVDTVKPSSKPTLYFLHVLLPHLPWTFLPNGNEYVLDARGLYGVPGVSKERWNDDGWAVQQGYQRHLLQLGYVDRELGRLLDTLEKQKLFDDTLFVLTADHGVSFRENDARRPLTNSNAADILRIPLFIKAPRQSTGVVNDAPVETVDILPSIADVLGIDIPWAVDGLPALDERVASRTTRRAYQQNRRQKAVGNNLSRAGFDQLDDGLARKIALFGSGENPQLFHFGKFADLIGTQLNSLSVEPATPQSPTLLLDAIQRGSGAPWAITGKLELRTATRSNHYVAAVQEQTICATSRSYANSSREAAFVLFVGPACDLDNTSNIEVMLIDQRSDTLTLSRLNKRDID